MRPGFSLTERKTPSFGGTDHVPPPLPETVLLPRQGHRPRVRHPHGRKVYLGAHGSQESRDPYDRAVGEWIANSRRLPPRGDAGGPTVAIVVAAFCKHCQTYYAGSRGELGAIKAALRVLNRLYRDAPAADFGPLAFKAVRDEMIRLGWCRTYVNAQTNRLRRLFKWAAGNELAPASVWNAVQAVDGLRRGKTQAPESDPVKPVAESFALALHAGHLPHGDRAGVRPGVPAAAPPAARGEADRPVEGNAQEPEAA